MKVEQGTLMEMYRRMVLIREFELGTIDLSKRGQIKGAVHPYIGQEASGVGVCMALRVDDVITSTHRGHGHHLAKGADPKRLMAEIKGKKTGYCKGRGGSMHVAAFDVGSLGAIAIVGPGIPIAVGAALAFHMRGEDRVAVPFFGDGATNTGNFHEAVNMASIWRLPVIFMCENNQYAVSTNVRYSLNIENVSERAASYGIPGVSVDGNDVLAVYEVVTEAVARARRGEGPTLVETKTYRIEGHYAGEPQVYRDRAEVEEYRKQDPIKRFRDYLFREKVVAKEDLDAIDAGVKAEIKEAIRFALESPMPEPETAMDYIYV